MLTPTTRAGIVRVLRRLSQPSSLAGIGSLAVLAHVSAPQFAAATDAVAVVSGLLAVFFDDGSTPTTEN